MVSCYAELFSWHSPTCLFLLAAKLKKKKSVKINVKEFNGFRSYIQGFQPFWVEFCVWCKMKSSFILLHVDAHFPNTTEGTLLSPCTCLTALWANLWVTGLHWPVVSVSMSVPYCFDCFTLWNQESVMHPTLFLFLQDCFGYSGVFCGSIQILALFYSCEKRHWNFDEDCTESLDCFEYYEHLTMLIIQIH